MKKNLLKLLHKLDPLTQGKVRCVYYNFLQNISGQEPKRKFSIEKSGETSYLLTVADEKIYIAVPQRVGFYKDGILNRIRNLQSSFYSSQGIGKGDVVIDIGSNIGEYAISFHDSVRVHSFEMDPNVIPTLLLNCQNHKNVTVHSCGLWSEPTTLQMYVKSSTADTSLINNGSAEKRTVECMRLDDVDAIKNLTEVAMIKCDAEGAEPEVLLGALQTLKKTRRVAIDCGPERGLTSDRTDVPVKNILESSGFRIVKERFGSREILVAENTLLP